METVEKKPTTKKIEFMALLVDEPKSIICRGFDIEKVLKAAKSTGKNFIIDYRPVANQTFIFGNQSSFLSNIVMAPCVLLFQLF